MVAESEIIQSSYFLVQGGNIEQEGSQQRMKISFLLVSQNCRGGDSLEQRGQTSHPLGYVNSSVALRGENQGKNNF